MEFASLSSFFCGYALETIYFVLNNISSKSVSKTPYEILSGCRPTLSHLRVWRYLAYVKHLQTDKLRPRSDKYYFIGFSKEMKEYYSYLTDE